MSYQRKITRFLLPELAIAITLAFLLLVSPAYAEGELPPAEAEPAATKRSRLTPCQRKYRSYGTCILRNPFL